MSRWTALSVALLAVLGGTPPTLAQPPGTPKDPVPLRNVGVKSWTEMGSCGEIRYFGVIEKVKGRQVTLKCYTFDEKPKSRTFEAIDILADGGMVKNADGGWAYLWSDMQKGDTVTVEVARDTEEDKEYVMWVKIDGRVGGKVPPSQKPKYDEERLGIVNVLNDINNGSDVDDAEIAKWLPTRFTPYSYGEPPPPPIPGGLTAEYQKKLDAIRAKKKKDDVKATPPEKK